MGQVQLRAADEQAIGARDGAGTEAGDAAARGGQQGIIAGSWRVDRVEDEVRPVIRHCAGGGHLIGIGAIEVDAEGAAAAEGDVARV